MPRDSTPRPLGEKLVSGGWIALGIVIPVSFLFSGETFGLSSSLALLSLMALCAALACWPRLFLGPINYRGLCDDVPRGSAIAMSLFIGFSVLRGLVELAT